MGAFYRHIPAVIRSLGIEPKRILDAGCGAGQLMSILRSEFGCDVYGYDISPRPGTPEKLRQAHPDVTWEDRISIVGPEDPLPYEDQFFDVVVSNMVVEHVQNLEHFVRETRRVAKTGVHCFPSREIIWEDHIRQPLTHRFPNNRWIDFWLSIGVGRKRARNDWEDYFANSTAYRPLSEIKRIFENPSLEYSGCAVTQKLSPRKEYSACPHIPMLHWLLPITVVCR